ncbi:MAG: transcription antitermination factor NusB [Candidatus Zixiibacteriota bacterium]
MKEPPRRKARELVLQALYASDCSETSPEEIFSSVIKDEKLSDKNLEFSRSLYNLVQENAAWADEQISRLAEHWDVNRIAVIDRDIIRMAMVELARMPETPFKVVLNEAIELARKFSTSESPAFVNGILDAYVKEIEKVRKE